MLIRSWTFLLLLHISCFIVAGCSSPAAIVVLHDQPVIQELSSDTGPRVAAWSPDASWLALGGRGLELLDLNSGRRFPVSREEVTALAWHPGGLMLAAATHADNSCVVRTYDLDGASGETLTLQGGCQYLSWTDHGLLVLESRLQLYSFGGAFKQVLHQWDKNASPLETLLYETTLRLATVANGKIQTTRFGTSALSPAGDLFALTEAHDPPAGRPFMRLVIWHLPSGEHWAITDLDLGSRVIRFAADGETVYTGDKEGGVRQWDVWRKSEVEPVGAAEAARAVSVDGRFRWLGDRLMRDDVEQLQEPDVSEAVFSPNGKSLLLIRKGKSLILSGLSATPPPEPPSKQVSGLKTLREWRSRGLISLEEYQHYRQRILAP